MAELEGRVAWRLADALRGALGGRAQDVPQTGTATFVRRDDDGTAWVRLPGNDFDTPVDGSVLADAQEGDTVPYAIGGGQVSVTGNASSPAVGMRAVASAIAPVQAAVRRAAADVAAASGIAAAAQRVASAVNQHFWTDTGGAHVTEVTQEEFTAQASGRNILLNAYGILLRDAEAWLASFTDGAIAFFDGAGNAAANVVARFGTDGAQIGRSGESHMTVTEDGIAGINVSGMSVFEMLTNGADASDNEFKRVDTYLDPDASVTESFSLDLSGIDQTNPVIDIMFWTGESQGIRFTYGTAETKTDVGQVTGTPVTVAYDGESAITFTERPSFIRFEGYRYIRAYKAPTFAVGTHYGTLGSFVSALGRGLRAAYENQTVIGKYNENDSANAFEIGNGSTENYTSNAFAVGWDGNMDSYIYADSNNGHRIHVYDLPSSGTSSSSNTYANLLSAYDKDGVNRVHMRAVCFSNGRQGLQLETRSNTGVNYAAVYNALGLYVDGSGNRIVSFTERAPWLDALGITPSDTTMTINTTNTTSIGNNHVRRSGKVVTIQFTDLKIANAVANNTATGTLATVPSGYRPSWNVYFPLIRSTDVGGSYYRIDGSGKLVFRNVSGAQIAAGATFAGTVTYVIE